METWLNNWYTEWLNCASITDKSYTNDLPGEAILFIGTLV